MWAAENPTAGANAPVERTSSAVRALWTPTEIFSTFDQTGGRIGSGVRGSGQGGVGRCRS